MPLPSRLHRNTEREPFTVWTIVRVGRLPPSGVQIYRGNYVIYSKAGFIRAWNRGKRIHRGEKACVTFTTAAVASDFDWKSFLLLFGFEQHTQFRHVLQQFNASLIPYRGVGYGEFYCVKVERAEEFLQAISQLVTKYFQPVSMDGTTASSWTD